MPEPGAEFTDWQGSRRTGLVVDDDFSWSDPPAPRRRITGASPRGRAVSGTIVIERGGGQVAPERYAQTRGYDDRQETRGYDDWQETRGYEDWQEPAPAHHYSNAEIHEYAHPRGVDAQGAPTRSDDYYFDAPRGYEDEVSGRRTVVITGRGAERNVPRPRPRRDSELAFYERGGFRPDSIGMWAVLLGLALLFGSVIH